MSKGNGRLKRIEKISIDWEKTGAKLRYLRQNNQDLRRYACSMLKYDKQSCDGLCATCDHEIDMDPSISREELAEVFNVNATRITNWETNKSKPSIEDLLLYMAICKFDNIFDIIVLNVENDKE